ncbi:Serine/threonine-protein kinase PknA [Enhygromyxa salina]|uniref:Serine/threonine-protein kinase PknA n=1 Tax=Enhygromyxa salina TaxID=215803 RepID=A0A2S9YCW4_9BACT|nr:serine/threonine-protein kinase [Enhygromyxa salina]PRQ02954.1 Serine/threonine-protein kinase PknA [Enhygromyxa salina]
MSPLDHSHALSLIPAASLNTWYDPQLESFSGLSAAPAMKLADRVARGHEPVLGELLGDYELERLVGAGSMGQVFAARSRATGERVALKVLRPDHGRALLRLEQEFRALESVEHPNFVKPRELVMPAEGEAFFTMELIDGVPFVEYVRQQTRAGQLPNQLRLRRALRQLLAALEHLHQRGYVHRDLKPSNVLVTPSGRVVVLDLGLVCDADAGDPIERGLVGTPAYMAPEQARQGQTGPAADLYAVGVMLYECLCGAWPFMGAAQDILAAKVEDHAPDPALRTSQADADLLELCRTMLAGDPEQRGTASQALARLASPARLAPVRSFLRGRARADGRAGLSPWTSWTYPWGARSRALAALSWPALSWPACMRARARRQSGDPRRAPPTGDKGSGGATWVERDGPRPSRSDRRAWPRRHTRAGRR